MLPALVGVALIVGIVLGTALGGLTARSRAAAQLGELRGMLVSERSQAAQRIAALTEADHRNSSLAAMVSPVTESLGALAGRVESAEHARLVTQAELGEQLRSMAQANTALRDETGRLTYALSRSEFRGRWGEAQLKRVVEAAGLIRGVHFVEQPTLTSSDSALRPDMIITLSNDRKIIIDSKVSLDALLAPEPSDSRHAAAIGTHIDQLASKQYWRQFTTTPEFVVMFLPAESLLGAALHADPGLLDRAFNRNVVLATPSTLLALLRTIAMGWRDEALADNARTIYEQGRDLHERLQVLSGHLGKLGSSLDGAVAAYNKTIGSWEGRVLVSARRMADLGVASEPLISLTQIDRSARRVAGVAVVKGGVP